jgi:hypothetical protein
MHQVPGRIDETCHLLLVKYGRQPPLTLGKWNVIGKIRPAQCLDEEKTQRCSAALGGSGRKLALAKQKRLILADMIRATPFRRAMEEPRKVFHRRDVRTYGALRAVATLGFFQHHLPKMGHKSLLVTQTLDGLKGWRTTDAAASAAPAAL